MRLLFVIDQRAISPIFVQHNSIPPLSVYEACRINSGAAKRHGPYFELTYKANGKTVNVKLSPEAAPLYRAAAQQYRKLKTLLNRLDKLSKTILRYQAELAESKHQN